MGERVTYLYPSQWIHEGDRYRFPVITLRDETGMAVPSSQLTSVLLTVYRSKPPLYPLVPGLDHVSILNDGQRGLMNTLGELRLTLLKEDTAIVDSTAPYEVRVALIEWLGTNSRAGSIEVEFIVRNLTKRPA